MSVEKEEFIKAPLSLLEGQDEKVHSESVGEGSDRAKPSKTVTRKPGGRNNALKHGAFSDDLILPGESKREFSSLLQSLFAEWKPNGALEVDTVLTLAKHIQSKRRLERFYFLEARWIRDSKLDEFEYIRATAQFLCSAPTMEAAMQVIEKLPGYWKGYVLREKPDPACKDVDNEVKRLAKSLLHLLRTEEEFHRELILQPPRCDEAKVAAAMRELTAKKIAQEERLDSMIDKAIKRLAQLKTLKQVIGVQASTTRIADQRSTSHQNQEVSGSAT
jgi:hypothetical protein